MKSEVMNLWNKIPGRHDGDIHITAYLPDVKKSDCAVIIFAGGAYMMRTPHSGKAYAEYLANNGICAFVTDYRVSPFEFPLPLLDARRLVSFVGYNAERYGIDKSKIAVMGTSAGGHLAALTSTYFEDIDYDFKDEIDTESYIPNAQILCYPVIYLYGDMRHEDSARNLLGERSAELAHRLTPINIVSDKTPPAFVLHIMADSEVSVFNSIDYVRALKDKDISAELHLFPDGWHGMGLADDDPQDKVKIRVSSWRRLLLNWLEYVGFINKD